MATLVLQTATSTLGSVLGPVGGALGTGLGAGLKGAFGDLLSGKNPTQVEGPRLTALRGIGSTEGAPVPRVYGRARIGAPSVEPMPRSAVRRGPSTCVGFLPERRSPNAPFRPAPRPVPA